MTFRDPNSEESSEPIPERAPFKSVKRSRDSKDSDATQMKVAAHFPPPDLQRDEEFRPVLICLSGELRGQRKALVAREMVIGRSSTVDWQIDDGITSRTHAVITYENVDDSHAMPRCYVEDLGSRNGTELNGKRIEARTRLVERDRLMVGSTMIGFFVRDSEELQHEMSLYNSATRDPLTGLHNRRQLLVNLKMLMSRAQQKQQNFAFILMDLDHFKSVNDTHGHDIGDEALKHVSTIIRQTVRETDSPSRWGGEEFAVVLPNAPHRAALRVAENLRRAIESQPLKIGDLSLKLTVSIGVAVFAENDSMESLYQRADQLLYRAKESGRNQVIGDEAPIRNSSKDSSEPGDSRPT